jgi:hypothetical protein
MSRPTKSPDPPPLTHYSSSCTLCRRRKLRCNREVPCSNCVRSKTEECIYDNEPPPRTQLSTVAHDGPSSSSPASTAASSEAETLKSQIKHLEQQLKRAQSRAGSSVPAGSPLSTIETSTTGMGGIGGSFHIHHGNPALGQDPQVSSSFSNRVSGPMVEVQEASKCATSGISVFKIAYPKVP